MSRQELIRKLKKKHPVLNQNDLEIIIDNFGKSIEEALRLRKNIEIRGFGTFFIKKINEKHSARNPKTGQLIYVPEKNKVRFRVSKKLHKYINS